MKREESEDVKKLRLEMEYRNYSLNSVKTYCDLMSFLEFSLSKKLEEITIEDLKGFLHPPHRQSAGRRQKFHQIAN